MTIQNGGGGEIAYLRQKVFFFFFFQKNAFKVFEVQEGILESYCARLEAW